MTQRERILAIAVGGLLLAVGLNWAFGKYRTAVQTRQNRLQALQREQQVLQERLLQGAYADRQMGEYLSRSLPSDPETARSYYQSWLIETAESAGLLDANVDPVTAIPVGDLYRRYGFSVTGRITMENLTDLLYRIASYDTLHRVRELTFAPRRDGDELDLKMAIDAISLNAAAEDATPPSEETSFRIALDWESQRLAILNRNFFRPPNEPPRLTSSKTLTATRGRDNELELKFDDPENHNLRFELQSELPEWVSFDSERGRLRVNPPGDLQLDEPLSLLVSVTDSGYPRRNITETFDLRVVDPPPPPSEPEQPGFDDATQTYLTALLDGKEPQAWMKVRTRGETLKLRVGDSFEIGSIKGKVVGIGNRTVQLEIDGETFEFGQSENLSDAVQP